jgi:hypothetical protein
VGGGGARTLEDNLEDGENTIFWMERWQKRDPFCLRFRLQFELFLSSIIIVAKMHILGWGMDEGGRRWHIRRKMFRSVVLCDKLYFVG